MIKKILIVDDNSTNRYMLETLLKGHGFEVISAENGQDALDKARLTLPNLIVSDILMPVMDGFVLCKECKSDNTLKHIPFVFYTATYPGSKNEAFALSLGADQFIIKPQEPDILMNILKEVLAEKYVVKQVTTKPLEEEMEFFRQYNEILFNKLEKKMSDLKTANQELSILEERYRLIFEHAMDVIYTISTDLNIISISPSVERILGYKPQEFIGRPVTDLGNILTPESFEQAIADTSFILKGETISATVYRFIAKDGTIKYGEVSGSPIMHEGKIISMISVARDITDRKLAEEALSETQDLLNEVGKIAKIGGWKMDLTSRKATWTQGTYDIVEIPPGRPIPGPDEHVDYYLPEYRPLVVEAMRALIEDDKPLDFEAPLCTAKGNVKWCRAMGRAVREGGKVVEVYGTFQDITEHKQAHEALRESEKKYRDLYDFLPIPVYEMDFEANIISANRAIYETFRGTEEDLKKGFKGWQLLSPEDVAKSAKNIERLLKGEQIGGTEYTLMRLDGTVFPAIIISSIIYSDGKPVGLRGAIIDITQRKQSEEALRESEARFRSYFELPLIGIAITSPEKGWIEVNNRLSDILGYSVQELKGMSWSELTYPEDLDADVEQFNRVLAGEIDSYMIDKRFIRKGGEVIWTSLAAGCVRKQDGTVDYFVVLLEDITVRKQAEEKEKETNTLLRIAGEKAKLGGWSANLEENRVIWSNEVAAIHEMPTGYSPSVEQGISFYPPEWQGRITKVFTDCAQKGIPYDEEMEIITTGGKRVWVRTIGEAVKNDAGKIIKVQGAFQDITVRKQAEKQLQDTLKSLRTAFGATVQVMISAVESRDPYTAGHQLRSANLACAIAKEMGLPQDKIEGLRMAGSIHDIGKLSIPAEILSKPTKLTNLEFSIIKEHSQKGYDMLKDVESPWPLAQIVYQHHERMNGSGYPRNLKGDEILMEARIMAVADVVEAMASHRPYRPALGINAALTEIEKNRGIFYDNTVADACLRLFREKGFQLEG